MDIERRRQDAALGSERKPRYVKKKLQGVPSQNVFFNRAKNVRKSICR